jgi:hypothetical protein
MGKSPRSPCPRRDAAGGAPAGGAAAAEARRSEEAAAAAGALAGQRLRRLASRRPAARRAALSVAPRATPAAAASARSGCAGACMPEKAKVQALLGSAPRRLGASRVAHALRTKALLLRTRAHAAVDTLRRRRAAFLASLMPNEAKRLDGRCSLRVATNAKGRRADARGQQGARQRARGIQQRARCRAIRTTRRAAKTRSQRNAEHTLFACTAHAHSGGHTAWPQPARCCHSGIFT